MYVCVVCGRTQVCMFAWLHGLADVCVTMYARMTAFMYNVTCAEVCKYVCVYVSMRIQGCRSVCLCGCVCMYVECFKTKQTPNMNIFAMLTNSLQLRIYSELIWNKRTAVIPRRDLWCIFAYLCISGESLDGQAGRPDFALPWSHLYISGSWSLRNHTWMCVCMCMYVCKA